MMREQVAFSKILILFLFSVSFLISACKDDDEDSGEIDNTRNATLNQTNLDPKLYSQSPEEIANLDTVDAQPIYIDGTTFDPPPANMQSSAANLSKRNKRFLSMIESASRKSGIEVEFIHAIISQESRYQPTIVSPAGAQGLMQLMPATGTSMGCNSLHDPVCNIMAGTRYMKEVARITGSNHLQTIAAGYNAGAGVAYSFLTGTPTKNKNKNPLGRQTPNGVPPDWWGRGETYNYARFVAGYYLQYKRHPEYIGKKTMASGSPSTQADRRDLL